MASVKIFAKGLVVRSITPIAAAALALAINGAIQGERPQQDRHSVYIPKFRPSTSSGCAVEEAAYAEALADLQIAEQVADDAYQAWIDCEMGGSRTPNRQPAISAEYSVLVR